MHKGNRERVCSGTCKVNLLCASFILDPTTRRGLNVMLVARDKVALEQLAVEVRAEGVQAKVVVEDFAKEGAVSRVVDKVPVSSIYIH